MNNSETLITKDRPHCDNCKFSHNNFSSIFGDAWTCLKDVKNHYDIFDNDWHLDQGEEIIPCEEFELGEPNRYGLKLR